MVVAYAIAGDPSTWLSQEGWLFWKSFIRGGIGGHGGDVMPQRMGVGFLPQALHVPFG